MFSLIQECTVGTLGTISLILSRKTGIARIMEVYLELHFAF